MKKILLFCLLLSVTQSVKPQSFTIQLSPDTSTITQGQNTSFALTAIPTGGFSASVFLSLQSFQTTAVTITPSTLNPPYNNCTVNVSSSNLMPGIYPLVIKGQQGSITSYDTAYIKVTFNPNLKWYQFKQQNSGILCNEPEGIAIDKNNFVYTMAGDIIASAHNCNSSNYGVSFYNHNDWQRWTSNQNTTTDFWGHQTGQQSFNLCSGNTGRAVVDSNNTVWIGSDNGLIRLKNNTDSCLFSTEIVNDVAVYNNKMCVATNSGFKYYNGTTWQTYNMANSPYLPTNNISLVAMENDTILWLGTNSGGVVRFDLHFWNIYNTSNTPYLTSNIISALTIDKLNNKWVATLGSKLVKYDNVSWHQFVQPCDEISALCADYQNNIWLGFQSGNTNNCLVKFNGSNFTQYCSSNSGFASDGTTPGYGRIHDIKQDKNHVLWISTFGDGLFAFCDSGLATVLPANLSGIKNQTTTTASSANVLVYPNPASGNFTISSPQIIDVITVTNLLGQTVTQINPNAQTTQINITKTGIYFVHVSVGNQTTTQKLIISN